MFYKTKGVTVNKRPASSGMKGMQSNKPQVAVQQRKETAKTVAKLVSALCKYEANCCATLWLLEESLDAVAIALAAPN
jgi:hypothetical protein